MLPAWDKITNKSEWHNLPIEQKRIVYQGYLQDLGKTEAWKTLPQENKTKIIQSMQIDAGPEFTAEPVAEKTGFFGNLKDFWKKGALRLTSGLVSLRGEGEKIEPQKLGATEEQIQPIPSMLDVATENVPQPVNVFRAPIPAREVIPIKSIAEIGTEALPQTLRKPIPMNQVTAADILANAAKTIPFATISGLKGLTEPFLLAPLEVLGVDTRALLEEAIKYYKPDLGRIPDITVDFEAGKPVLKGTESEIADILGSTAGGAGFMIGGAGPAMTAGKAITELPILEQAARPFYRNILAGMIGGALTGEGKIDETLQNAALFGVFEGLGGVIDIVKTALKIRKTRKWQEATVKERGLMIQSLEDTIDKNPDMTEAEILRTWNNPTFKEEALGRRARSAEGEAETIKERQKAFDQEAGREPGFVYEQPEGEAQSGKIEPQNLGAAETQTGETIEPQNLGAAEPQAEPVKAKPEIPRMEDTEDAIEFSKTATPEQLERVKELIDDFAQKNKEALNAGNINDAMKFGTQAQLLREVLQAKENLAKMEDTARKEKTEERSATLEEQAAPLREEGEEGAAEPQSLRATEKEPFEGKGRIPTVSPKAEGGAIIPEILYQHNKKTFFGDNGNEYVGIDASKSLSLLTDDEFLNITGHSKEDFKRKGGSIYFIPANESTINSIHEISGEILLSDNLKNNEKELRETLIHELTHWGQIQTGETPKAYYVNPVESIHDFMEYLSDPAEVKARFNAEGRSQKEFDDFMERLNWAKSEEAGKLQPFEIGDTLVQVEEKWRMPLSYIQKRFEAIKNSRGFGNIPPKLLRQNLTELEDILKPKTGKEIISREGSHEKIQEIENRKPVSNEDLGNMNLIYNDIKWEWTNRRLGISGKKLSENEIEYYEVPVLRMEVRGKIDPESGKRNKVNPIIIEGILREKTGITAFAVGPNEIDINLTESNLNKIAKLNKKLKSVLLPNQPRPRESGGQSIPKAESGREGVKPAPGEVKRKPIPMAGGGAQGARRRAQGVEEGKKQEPEEKKKIPKLGDTAGDVLNAFEKLDNYPQEFNRARYLGVRNYGINAGRLSVISQHRNPDGSYLSTYREATAQEEVELLEGISKGQVQIESVKRYGALGVRPFSDAGEVKKVYHQATGRPLEEEKADESVEVGAGTEGTAEVGEGGPGGEESEAVPGAEEPGKVEGVRGGQGAGDVGGIQPGVGKGDRGTGAGKEREEKPARKDEGDRGAVKKRVGRDTGNVPEFERRGSDLIIEKGGLERKGGWKTAAENNLKAIEIYKKIIEEDRPATDAEKKELVKYTGWGASELANKMFPGYSYYRKIYPSWAEEGWKDLVKKLTEVMTDEEIKTAARSTQYAHYTSEGIIRGICKALEKFGFKGGKILEPGSGLGHFIGLVPQSLQKKTLYTGIEMDKISGGISKLLYPSHNIITGDYTKALFPQDFFDAAIGNPPFGQIKILADPEYKKYRFTLHNYFFAKTIDRVRPGGVMVLITSHYTMDAGTDRMRKYLDDRADLAGAIRLPQTAFLKNAGTEVVTDVLFFKKRVKGEEPAGEKWMNLKEVEIGDKKAMINEYYADHPEMVLGKHSLEGTMYTKEQYTVTPIEGDIEELFNEAVKKLPDDIYSEISETTENIKQKTFERDYDPKNKKEGGLYLSDKNKLKIVDFGSGVDIESVYPKISANDKRWLKDYVGLRDAIKQNHFDQLTEGNWEKSLKELRKTYQNFIKKHGRILDFSLQTRNIKDEEGNPEEVTYRRFKNEKLLRMDMEGSLATALEVITEDGQIIEAPALTERTIKKPEEPKIETIPDALAVSLNEQGRLNLEHIAGLVNATREEVIESLGELIFKEPGKDYLLADEYLSGNVVKKLEEAKAAAETEPEYQRNVDALLKVQPEPLTHKDVTISPGMTWIPKQYLGEFGQEVLDLRDCRVSYNDIINNWSVDGKFSPQGKRGPGQKYGTADRGPNEIYLAALNNKAIKITRTKKADGKTTTYTDTAATTAANEKVKELKEKFSSWVWQDADRAKDLLEIYNRQFNNLAPRRFDGSHLTLPGVTSLVKLYDHQKRAIWRIIQTGNVYLAHAVGAGKTFEMIAAGMEMKRLGMISKPLYVVPKHRLGQFAREFNELYPTAHVMVADEKNFHTENRRRFVAQATLNNPDAIVVPHSSFGLFSLKRETIQPVRDAFLEDMRYALEEMEDDNEPNYLIKQMERRIENAEQRFDSMIAEGDKAITFEEMGVDYLFLDEAHEFRKLDYVTNQKIKGIDPVGSKRAMDLYIKTLWLESQNPGRSHTFASGTPITNTLGELYTVMRFFDPEGMELDGINHFDAWSSSFARAAIGYEMNAAGKYQPVERFSKFVNIPELMSRVRQFMDVLTGSQLSVRVKLPDIEGTKPEVVITESIPELQDYQDNVLAPRIKASMEWKPSPYQKGNPDPLINIITDGRLASIDMRFVRKGALNNPKSKLNKYIDDIIEAYKASKNDEYLEPNGKKSHRKGATIVGFFNHGFGKAVALNRGLDARKWVMSRFKTEGVSANDVAWIEDYNTAAKKEALFKDLRNGKKRILFGSAKKMGTGMNVQTRLKYLFYLDPPWYPSDVEQPMGRIVRQGNQNESVIAKWYATKGSYDSTMWQLVSTKSKFIEKAFLGEKKLRSMEDLSEASQYEMASALAAGDERMIKVVALRAQVGKYENLWRDWHHGKYELEKDIRWKTSQSKDNEKRIDDYKKQAEFIPEGHIKFEEGIIGDRKFDKRDEFNDAMINKIRSATKEDFEKSDEIKIADINGFGVYHKIQSKTKKGDIRNTSIVLRIGEGLETDWYPEDVSTAKIINYLNSIESKREELIRINKNLKEEIRDAQKRLETPFEYEREYNEAIAELTTLESDLASEGEAVELGKQAEEKSASLEGGRSTSFEERAAPLREEEKIRPERSYDVPKGYADVGGYATNIKFMLNMPEIVRLARDLMKGRYPSVRERMGNARGRFYPAGNGRITIQAGLFRNEAEAAAVLSHEIGHLVDWLPDKDIRRGNILGRIASLKQYMKKSLPRSPDDPVELTKKDRDRLRNQARKMARAETKDTWIDEVIRKELPISPQDVINIWNTLEDAKAINPDLYDYVARLSTAEKKAVIKDAMGGVVREELKQFAKVIEEKTGNKIKLELSDEEVKELVKQKYTDLVNEELTKRKMFSYETIVKELRQLTRIWKPFDPAVNPKYTKYRYSGKELYADAFSAILNAPGFVKSIAPEYYEAFFNYMERKPEVKLLYDEIQNRMSTGEIDKERTKELYGMFKKGDEAYALSLERKDSKYDAFMRDFIDAQHMVLKKIRRVGERTIPPGENPRYKLEEMTYTGSEVEWLLGQIKAKMIKPLEEVSLTWDDFGAELYLRRVSGERKDLANPQGWTARLADEKLDELKKLRKNKQNEAMRKAVDAFQEIRDYVINKAEEAGRWDPEMIKMMRDIDTYATFDVIKYIEKRHGIGPSAKIYKQVGTFNEVANPATASILKDIAIIKAINRAVAAESVVKFMQKYYPNEIRNADRKWNGRFREIQDAPVGSDEALIIFLKDGKAEGYYVHKWIADMFTQNPIEGHLISKILGWSAQPFRKIFVDLNPGFQLFNLKRDFMRSHRNLPGTQWRRFAKYWAKGIKPAFKSAFGIPDPVIEELLQGKMLISIADIRGQIAEDAQIERMLKMYHLKKSTWDNKVMKPFGMFFNFIENTGRAIERIPKVGGYLYLKEIYPDLPDEVIGHMIRVYAGSPAFLRRGRFYPIYNNFLLFSNAMKEGYRGDYESMADNPGQFWWKMAKYVFIPKLLMWAAGIGLLGFGAKTIMDGISDYDKTNYLIIPIGLTENGKSVYLRVPTDETGRLMGGVMWKALSENKTEMATSLFDYMAGQAPTLHPGLDMLVSTIRYCSGLNPYDSFRGRYAIPEQVFEAGGARKHEAFLKWMSNKAGAGIVYKFKYDDIDRIQTELEKILGYPIASNIIGRFVKVSNQGLKELGMDDNKILRKLRARENLAVKESIAKILRGEKLEPTEGIRLLNKLEESPEMVDRNLQAMLARKYGQVYMEMYITAQTKEEKAAVFQRFLERTQLLDKVWRNTKKPIPMRKAAGG